MKKGILIGLLGFLCMVHGGSASADPKAVQLTDIQGHWAESAIINAVEKGYVAGYPDHTFMPDHNVTRAEFIKMLVEALKLPHSEGGAPWYQPYAAAAVEMKIHHEADFTDYGKPVTRLEMMRLGARSLALHESYRTYLDSFDTLYNGDIPFTDYRELEQEDVPFAALALGSRIMNGYPDASMGLNKNATRAEAVVIIENVLRQKAASPETMQYLKELKEIAETGTNTKAVSNLVPDLNVYEDPVTIEHNNYTVKIKRYYVLPIEANDTVSFYERKFLWDRTKLESRFVNGKEYYVIAVVDLTPKRDGMHYELFSPSLYANPSVPFSDKNPNEKYKLLYPFYWLATEMKNGVTTEVVLYGSYRSSFGSVAVRANAASGREDILLVKDKE